MITREEILKSEETAKLVNEFIGKSPIQPRNITWKEFVETKLNEGKFKTEDGVIVGDKTVMYGVYHHNFNVAPNLTPSQIDKANTPCKWFSTPSARQTWIEDNKPLFNKNEFESMIEDILNYGLYSSSERIKYAKKVISDLVKSKL